MAQNVTCCIGVKSQRNWNSKVVSTRVASYHRCYSFSYWWGFSFLLFPEDVFLHTPWPPWWHMFALSPDYISDKFIDLFDIFTVIFRWQFILNSAETGLLINDVIIFVMTLNAVSWSAESRIAQSVCKRDSQFMSIRTIKDVGGIIIGVYFMTN